MHDPRVGRFFATDPLSRKYPFYTPYSFSGNKVTAFSELEGLEEAWVIRDSKIVTVNGPTTTVANGFTNFQMALVGLHFKMHNQQSLDTFMAMWDEGEIDPTGVPKNQSYLRATQPEWEKYPEHYMGQTMAPYMFEAGKEIVTDAFIAGVLTKAKKLSKAWDFIKLGLKTGGAVSRNYAVVSNELRGIYKRIKSIENQNMVLAHAANDLKKFKEISFDEMRSVAGRGVGEGVKGSLSVIKNGGRFKDYNKARNAALDWFKANGGKFKADQVVYGKFGKIKGKPIGMKTADGKVGFRIEYDARSKAHINVWSGKTKEHILFDASENTVTKLQSIFGN